MAPPRRNPSTGPASGSPRQGGASGRGPRRLPPPAGRTRSPGGEASSPNELPDGRGKGGPEHAPFRPPEAGDSWGAVLLPHAAVGGDPVRSDDRRLDLSRLENHGGHGIRDEGAGDAVLDKPPRSKPCPRGERTCGAHE